MIFGRSKATPTACVSWLAIKCVCRKSDEASIETLMIVSVPIRSLTKHFQIKTNDKSRSRGPFHRIVELSCPLCRGKAIVTKCLRPIRVKKL